MENSEDLNICNIDEIINKAIKEYKESDNFDSLHKILTDKDVGTRSLLLQKIKELPLELRSVIANKLISQDSQVDEEVLIKAQEWLNNQDEFKKNFRPVSEKPEKGQVLACFRAAGEFIDGWEKRHVIDLIKNEKSKDMSLAVLRKIVHIAEKEANRVIDQIESDLKRNTPEEVAKKPYKIVIEHFFWAKREAVPNSPHWNIVETKDLRENA